MQTIKLNKKYNREGRNKLNKINIDETEKMEKALKILAKIIVKKYLEENRN